ncbi:MAG: hypothetical protein AAGI12_10595 [Pseudomonadota bacterium]
MKRAVVCLKWGTAYGPHYVNLLFRSVQAQLGLAHAFVCVTDSPEGLDRGIDVRPFRFAKVPRERWTPGQWPKVSLFNQITVGDFDEVMFLDLDVLVMGELAPLFQRLDAQTDLVLIPRRQPFLSRMIPSRFRKPLGGGTSVYVWRPATQAHLWDGFRVEHTNQYAADDFYATDLGHRVGYFNPRDCVGFLHTAVWRDPLGKLQRRYPYPSDARVVIFYAGPKPFDLLHENVGRWGAHHRWGHGPLPWLREHVARYGLLEEFLDLNADAQT